MVPSQLIESDTRPDRVYTITHPYTLNTHSTLPTQVDRQIVRYKLFVIQINRQKDFNYLILDTQIIDKQIDISFYLDIQICSFHVNGSYWHTCWESRIIDLNYTPILLNQRAPQAIYKFLVSLSSGSVDLLSQYKPFVLNLCTDYSTFMYSIYPLYFFYTPCSGVSRSSLEGC